MTDKHIAILGFDSLRIFALKSILKNYDKIECVIANSIDDISVNLEQVILFIVTSETFVSNIEFFLPKKNRVIIISENVNKKSDFVNHISYEDDIETIYEQINNVLTSLTDKQTEENTLSSREIDVLKEIATGKINKEIADKLNISVNTVITHRKNISAKLGIRSVSGLSLYAMMNGII